MFQGELLSIDNQTNLLLSDAIERVITQADDGRRNEIHPLGTYLIRGDVVLLCGLVDEEMDADINWMEVKGGPIETTKRS
jgi:U6 snRNA-associated Sm-like protein LSm8